MSLRFRCTVCGKLTAGRIPKGGDGTFRFPRRHRGADGEPCPGNMEEAEWASLDTILKRRVVCGEVEGTAYRAHFDGEPSAEALAALEEVVKAARKCLDGTCEHPECIARREKSGS